MAERVRIIENGNNEVHFSWGAGADYTLCGLNNDSVGDSTGGINAAKKTNRKVDCAICVSIVKFCKSIKSTEYHH